MGYNPSWNLRKEILIGTQQTTNPQRAMARRASLICTLISGHASPASYYYWLLDRIGTGTSTRFYIDDAAAELGVSRRALKYWNKILKMRGLLKITKRSHQGQNTYAEYTLNPVNDLIHDEGVAPQKAPQKAPQNRVQKLALRPSAKVCTTKTALEKERDKTGVFSLSHSHPSSRGSKNTEAVPPCGRRSADFIPSGVETSREDVNRDSDSAHHSSSAFSGPETASGEALGSSEGGGSLQTPESLRDTSTCRERPSRHPLYPKVFSWCQEHGPFLQSCGFREKRASALASDILAWLDEYDEPEKMWTQTFCDQIWLRLHLKLPTVDFIGKGHHTLGAGWLFRSDKQTGDVNMLTLIASQQYGGLSLPSKLPLPGELAHINHDLVEIISYQDGGILGSIRNRPWTEDLSVTNKFYHAQKIKQLSIVKIIGSTNEDNKIDLSSFIADWVNQHKNTPKSIRKTQPNKLGWHKPIK